MFLMKQIQADAHIGRGEDTASFSGMLAQATDKVYQAFILGANFSEHHSPASQLESLKSPLWDCTMCIATAKLCLTAMRNVTCSYTRVYKILVSFRVAL